jgi:hypothetical protein
MDDCIEWQGTRTAAGYGTLRRNNKMLYAHRLIFELATGQKIPPGMVIMHSCDNPPCINMLHLSMGTQVDNMQDCSRKGRIQRTNASKRFCKNGHEFTPENTWTNGKRRQCRACLKARKEVYRARGTDASVRDEHGV